MKTIVIDGKEYVLVPKDELEPVIDDTLTTQDATRSPLDDFDDQSVVLPPAKPIDDGLATQDEKKKSIRVVTQDEIVETLPVAPPAQPKKYDYRERYLKKELMPSDVLTFSRIDQSLLKANPEDPMIKADANRPKENQLFYGPGVQIDGA